MLISESYKKRLKKLAGLITEELYDFTDQERTVAYKDFDKRIPFSKDLMSKAIREGWEVGIIFQSDNDKYKMPIAKTRIIYPVAMGLSKKGNLVIRAFHKIGQSESGAGRAKKQGVKNYRSAEVKDEWRMFKASGIKNMWLTGDFFKLENISGYREVGDKGMTVVEVQAKKKQVSDFQKDYYNKIKGATEKKPETIIVKNKPFEKLAREPKVEKIDSKVKNLNKDQGNQVDQAAQTNQTNQQK
jgi:hypothetical protein